VGHDRPRDTTCRLGELFDRLVRCPGTLTGLLSYWGGGLWSMPRPRDPDAPQVVYRTARVGVRLTVGQRRPCFGLLRSAADVWACVLELNWWRRHRRDRPAVGYQELCRQLSTAGAGTFGQLDSVGARSVLRRFSDAWFAADKRRKAGDANDLVGNSRSRRGGLTGT
jgi:hypothetical protein